MTPQGQTQTQLVPGESFLKVNPMSFSRCGAVLFKLSFKNLVFSGRFIFLFVLPPPPLIVFYSQYLV